ncbi:glycosyl transferase [Chryseotalea sanaruensis]|uniref:Glycosyl transferase n=1 Tax=Chryseotalea sanaruensis TaxID=2482724 RepID=A0A401U4V3_9BACT|nr:glycosyltransferase family protein [Chryseotalea sanaruensis]GCC49912.1 glycosyl transferase [Chryseotalea sanaruensis]
MKILYAIQGTGNGHLARAEDIIPELQKHGKLDLFVSGAQADIKLDHPVKYKSKGLSFYFGKGGGVDLLKTFRKNSSKDVYREIKEFPVEKYDLVINDFEPISAWACRRKNIPCVALSHQSALLSPKVPSPKHYDPVGDWILKNYAPAQAHVGFHFAQFDSNIYTPVIRSGIRKAINTMHDHYTVYLPAYDDRKLVPLLAKLPYVRWHIFSKHTKKAYHIGKLSVYPVNKEEFEASMTSAKGVLCGAGFETPAETLYLHKKLMVVPMKNQYEQYYNAAALKELNVPVLKNLKKKRLETIAEWIESDIIVNIDYPDITEQAVNDAVSIGKSL